MATIYEQHDAAFANVSAYVVAKDGERVATIAFKFPRDGAGRLYVYVHWLGVQMVRGHAGGYGYDKRSAARSVAAKKLHAVRAKATPDDGRNWDDRLRDAGFAVWGAC